MTKHILDHERTTGDGRSAAYPALDRKAAPEGSHPATQALLRRPADRSGARTAAFARIERSPAE